MELKNQVVQQESWKYHLMKNTKKLEDTRLDLGGEKSALFDADQNRGKGGKSGGVE
jgi:hypothetical protein